jgi:hypothetical protein
LAVGVVVHPIVGLAVVVGGSRWLSPEDALKDPQPGDHNPIADAIERSPPETTGRVLEGAAQMSALVPARQFGLSAER